MRVYHRVQRRETAHLHTHGLTLPQLDVLAQLAGREGITQQALADRLFVTKGNVCVVLDRLEGRGLVERRADPTDRRANLVYLTPAGRELAARVVPDNEALLDRLLSGLSPAEQAALLGLLRRLDRSLASDATSSQLDNRLVLSGRARSRP